MAKQYDIAQRIANAGQKPTVKLDDDHEYTINTGKSVAIMIDALARENPEDTFNHISKMIELALGKDAAQYIEGQDYPLPALEIIVETIMAAFQGVDEVEKPNEKKTKKS